MCMGTKKWNIPEIRIFAESVRLYEYQKGGQILYNNMNISNVSSESVRLHFFKIFALPLLFSLAKLTSDTRHFDLNSILSMTFLQSSLCTLELFGIFEKKGISVAFFVPLYNIMYSILYNIHDFRPKKLILILLLCLSSFSKRTKLAKPSVGKPRLPLLIFKSEHVILLNDEKSYRAIEQNGIGNFTVRSRSIGRATLYPLCTSKY